MTREALVAACSERLQPLERAVGCAWWDANTEATAENEQARVDADVAYSDSLADADTFAAVRAARAEANGDPIVARSLALLEQLFAPQQVAPELRHRIVELQSSLEQQYATHRGELDGRSVDDNQIRDVLRTSDDNDERRAAWEASKSVGVAVAADVRDLARLRNDAARALGYRDHFALTLATTEFDEQKLFATLHEVDEITRAPFEAVKAELDERLAVRFRVRPDDLRSWHYADPFFQEAQPDAGVDLDPFLTELAVDDVTIRTFDDLGLDVRTTLARSDLEPRDRKSQHAFCIDIDRAGDIRVLSNNVPGTMWTETMLHEFGHSVYFDGVGRDLPWVLRTMHMCLTEGVAMQCGRFVNDPAWLRSAAGLASTTVDELVPQLRAARRASLLIFARWVLVMTHFERGLYANPDGPHDAHWWDLVERYQLVPRPDGRAAPDWAAKMHIAVAPVYYHNYLYGELIASHLDECVQRMPNRRDAGTFLKERVFAPGQTMRWDQLIEHATGSPLSPAVLARDLAV
jgi:peptidyl-dipeptidase A